MGVDDRGGADFPAAHSMDTDWFAVDADGRVALLDSGEAGSVSDAFLSYRAGGDQELWIEYLGQALEQSRDAPLLAQLDDVAASVGASEALAPGGLSELDYEGTATPRSPESLEGLDWPTELLLWVDEGVVASGSEPAVAQANVLRCSAGGELVHFEEIAGEAAASVVQRLLVRGVLRHGFYGQTLLEPQRLGLYHYDCQTYGDDPPYVREAEPLADVRITDLPPALRDPALRTRFVRARFADKVRLRVTRHVTCSGWGANEVGPLPFRAPTAGIIELDGDGAALLRAALLEEAAGGDEGSARAVLADWLQDRQHPLGEALAHRAPPLFPDALDLLALPLQQQLSCEMVDQTLPLLRAADDELFESAELALDLARRFAAGRLAQHNLHGEAEPLILFGCWLGLISPVPWARDVALEAAWLWAYARAGELGDWQRARDEAQLAQVRLLAERLEQMR